MLGSLNGPAVLIGKGQFMGWVDNRRFLYYYNRDNTISVGSIAGEMRQILSKVDDAYAYGYGFAFILMNR